MLLSLLVCAYIIVALLLYYRDKSFFRNSFTYAQHRTNIPPGALQVIFFLSLLALPFMYLQISISMLLEKVGLKQEEPLEKDEFMEEYYPELYHELPSISFGLLQEDLSSLLDMLQTLCESSFSDLHRQRLLKLLSELAPDIEEKLTFYIRWQEKRLVMVIAAELPSDEADTYKFSIYADDIFLDALEQELNNLTPD